MSDSKNELQHVIDKLKGLEERARGLKNQNLADVVARAHGGVKQLSEHPDLELVEDRKDPAPPPTTKEEAIERLHADGDADPEGTARKNWPHLFGEPLPFNAQA